ncbi:MAG: hypothetical protein Q9166_004219 [cf. Caloplaca sp. 2 TL-2023]
MDDNNDLPTSPRKKLKVHHDSDVTMADCMVSNVPSANNEHPHDLSIGDDRLDKEVHCGIVEYVSPELPGFTGILKKRYTDFLVNEILPNGQVIHLDSLKISSEQNQLSQAASKNPQKQSVQELRRPAPAEENARPQFESTNLNEIEEGLRKKEKVFMRHGADTLSLVNGEDASRSAASKPTMPATEDGNIEHEVPQPLGSGSKDLEEAVADGSEKQQTVEAGLPKPTSEGKLVHVEAAGPTQSGPSGSVGGWQAYAQSNTNGGGLANSSFQLSDDDRHVLVSYFDTEVVEQILELFQRILASPLRKARDFGTVTTQPIEREVRTNIHQAMRRIFSSRLDTTTDGDGAMVIAAANTSSNRGKKNNAGRNDWNNKPQQPKGKAGWAVLGGDYLHFTIYKENKDTMELISYLARTLKLRPQLFQFAGTKDRRGITVQRASVYRTQAQKLMDVGRTLRNAKIGNYEHHPVGLQLGDLKGNEFVITLRDCRFRGDRDLDFDTRIKKASSIVGTAIENFTSYGFINYYGLQRFGSFSTGTHTIGRSMLQGDFKAACEAILWFHPSALAAAQQDPGKQDSDISRDDMARASALHAFETTGKSHPALDQLPRKFSAEACLIRHLARTGHQNDYLGALQTISRNLRLMYVHAYQSLMWNVAATARWKAHGNNVLPGDLVLVTERPEPSTQPDTEISNVDQDGEPIVTAGASDRAYTTDEIFTRARAITESELASPNCKISIFDIVLPTPGYDILYPANDSANIYKEFMASEEGGGLDPYDMRRKWKDVSLSGSYRKLLAKPLRKVEWEIRSYGERGEDEQFVETDVERMEKVRAGGRGLGGLQRDGQDGEPIGRDDTTVNEESSGGQYQCPNYPRCGGFVGSVGELCARCTTTHGTATISTEAMEATTTEPTLPTNDIEASATTKEDHILETKNNKIAVILKMQLGSSTYATMALRELMKEGGVRTWKVEYGGGR